MTTLNETKIDILEKCENDTDNTLIRPQSNGNNMNDFKGIDLNSADDVRQTIKSLFSSKLPSFSEGGEDCMCVKDAKYRDTAINIRPDLVTKNIATDDIKLHIRTSKKRPGRPSKMQPSKRKKKQNVSSLYAGKLSNVVFSNRHGSESDSDID